MIFFFLILLNQTRPLIHFPPPDQQPKPLFHFFLFLISHSIIHILLSLFLNPLPLPLIFIISLTKFQSPNYLLHYLIQNLLLLLKNHVKLPLLIVMNPYLLKINHNLNSPHEPDLTILSNYPKTTPSFLKHSLINIKDYPIFRYPLFFNLLPKPIPHLSLDANRYEIIIAI